MSVMHHRLAPPAVAAFAAVVLLGSIAGCSRGADPGPELSAAGERGEQISLSSGCSACHGANGEGGVGPAWRGLAGSQVELADGSTVVADDAYLARAITDPGADLLADYTIQMPANRLDDAQVADVIAYIKDLSSADE